MKTVLDSDGNTYLTPSPIRPMRRPWKLEHVISINSCLAIYLRDVKRVCVAMPELRVPG